jgi:hypothetical protein
MKLCIASLLLALASDQTVAFTSPSATKLSFHNKVGRVVQRMPTTSVLYSLQTPEEQKVAGGEAERLKLMAQKLRAEAALLEAERALEQAELAESAFRKFDTNQDGEIGLEELKAGLEKALKIEVADKRVRQLMEGFDLSGDGKLQLDEFVGIDKFRNKLESLDRDEKQMVLDAKKREKVEADTAKLAGARLSAANEGKPTSTDKIISVLPYLFPLLDGLQFGGHIFMENQENPIVILLALAYTAYRSIPFSGFIFFLGLNFLSSNLGLNRLVRFNMQQAIFVDIALFFPTLLAALVSLIGSGAGFAIPQAASQLGSDVMFGVLILTVGYASISSALGITPDKIPIISPAVQKRMPSMDMDDKKD